MISTWKNLWLERNARVLFISQSLSQVCDKTMSIGLVWLIIQTYSIEILPWYLLVGFLPHLLAFPFLSSLIQKWTPLKTVIGADFFRGFIFLLLFIAHKSFSPSAFLVSLFFANFLIGLGSSFFNPAILSLPPKIVSEKNLMNVNALLDLAMSLSQVFAATLSILLLEVFSLDVLILLNMFAFIFGGFYQQRIEPLKPTENQKAETPEEKAEVFQIRRFLNQLSEALKRNFVITRMLTLFFILNLIMAPLFLFLPWYAQNVFGGRGSTLAWLESAWALGAVIGGLGLVSFEKLKVDITTSLWKMILVFALVLILFAYSPWFPQTLLLLVILGITISLLNIQILTFFQKSLNEKDLTLIMSAVNLISNASVPFSMLISGLILPFVHIPHMAFFCGVMTLVLATVFRRILNSKVLALSLEEKV